jgi:hypothetical protein
MKTKTLALTAVAALALPAAAQATKPAEPGKDGREKAASKKAAKTPKKPKGVGFTVKGTGLTALPVADGALNGTLSLDPASANKHARTLLGLSTEDVDGTVVTQPFGVAGDEVVVKYVGLTAADALQATDVVKVQGKVARTGKGKAKTLGTLDIRRITITRETAEEQAPAPTQS